MASALNQPPLAARWSEEPAQRRRWTLYAFAGLAVVAFAYLMAKGSGNGFYYDEWTWLVTRRNGFSGIFSAYNQHLVALPSALYQLLDRTVGLRDYWVYRLLLTAAHVGCAAAVFEFARRRVGAAALLPAIALLFFGYGYEYILWAVNVGFVASIALSVCALLVLERDGRQRDPLACALLVVALACSEFTVVFMIGIALELSLRDRSPRRAWVWALPLLLYVAWYLGYHEPSSAASNLGVAPAFAAELAGAAIGGLFGLGADWGRALLVAAVILCGWSLGRRGRLSSRSVAVLVIAGGFWLLVALGRAQLGDATAPRYLYTGAMLLVLVFAEAAKGVRLTPRQLGAGLLVALFSLAGNLAQMTDGEDVLKGGTQTVDAELAALTAARAVVSPAFLIDAHYMPGITAGGYFAAADELGSAADSPAGLRRAPEPARAASDLMLTRAGNVTGAFGARESAGANSRGAQLGAAGSPSAHGTAPPAVLAVRGGVTIRSGSCLRYEPAPPHVLDLPLPPTGLAISATRGPVVAVRVRRFASGFENPPVSELDPSHTLVLRPARDRLATAPWDVRVSPAHPVIVCSLEGSN